MQSVVRFLKAFRAVAKPVCATSFVAMVVGFCFTAMVTGKLELARLEGIPWQEEFDLPAVFIMLLILSCYLVFLWVAAYTSVDTLDEEHRVNWVEVIDHGGLVQVYWHRALWKIRALLFLPMVFSSLAGGVIGHFWLFSVPLMTVGWMAWWYGWFRLFRGAGREYRPQS